MNGLTGGTNFSEIVMNYGTKCDDIFRTHEKDIVNCLWRIVTSAEANCDGKQPKEQYIRHLFDLLPDRLLKLCKTVETKCIDGKLTAPIDRVDVKHTDNDAEHHES